MSASLPEIVVAASDEGLELVRIDMAELPRIGFTESGTKHYQKTVLDYASTLREKSTKRGELDKAANAGLEVTHEHVRAAAHHMARSFGVRVRPYWLTATQSLEYLATAIAGVGGGHLATQQGQLAFGLGLGAAVILAAVRITHTQGE